jgi:hypothetical protein
MRSSLKSQIKNPRVWFGVWGAAAIIFAFIGGVSILKSPSSAITQQPVQEGEFLGNKPTGDNHLL